MIKVLHIGAFDRNVGDNIALLNAQKLWKITLSNNVSFKNCDIGNFWSSNNNIQESKKIFTNLSKHFDCILVGGGGLIECQSHHQTGWKLPFNNEIFKSIKIPVFFQGVGINCFRGGEDYTPKAKAALTETIENSAVFSLRNDGSLKKLKDWIGIENKKIVEVPDPGLMFYDHKDINLKLENINTIKKFGIQPAWNGGSDLNAGINLGRFINLDNIDFLKKITSEMEVYPHTGKDFNRLLGKTVISMYEYKQKYRYINHTYKFIKKYSSIDCIIAMRGHGQLISIGMNLPGIYFSTQDKVRDFSLDNGFQDYNIDILESNWRDRLLDNISKFKNDNQFLINWYSIRDKNLATWENQNEKFIKKCMERLK